MKKKSVFLSRCVCNNVNSPSQLLTWMNSRVDTWLPLILSWVGSFFGPVHVIIGQWPVTWYSLAFWVGEDSLNALQQHTMEDTPVVSSKFRKTKATYGGAFVMMQPCQTILTYSLLKCRVQRRQPRNWDTAIVSTIRKVLLSWKHVYNSATFLGICALDCVFSLVCHQQHLESSCGDYKYPHQIPCPEYIKIFSFWHKY